MEQNKLLKREIMKMLDEIDEAGSEEWSVEYLYYFIKEIRNHVTRATGNKVK